MAEPKRALSPEPSFLDLASAESLVRSLSAPPSIDRRSHLQAALGAGVSASQLARRIMTARRGPGRLPLDEFLYYRLYRPDISGSQTRRFVGKTQQHRFHTACNNPWWFATAHDKALFYQVALGGGIPIPETVAVYSDSAREFFVPRLGSRAELAAFLKQPSNYPLFAKPVEGAFSIGAFHFQGVSGENVVLKKGEKVPLETVLAFIEGLDKGGYLFQRPIRPHPMLAQAFGDSVSSVRFLLLFGKDGIVLESAVIKIPSARNDADNYWRAGNMLGALDMTTGTITRAISGFGEDLQEHQDHPDTGARLVGLKLPDWEEAGRMVSRAASMFPPIRTQSWDVALSDTGPLALELNFGGDLNLHQLAHDRGVLSDAYIQHLAACGVKKLKVEG